MFAQPSKRVFEHWNRGTEKQGNKEREKQGNRKTGEQENRETKKERNKEREKEREKQRNKETKKQRNTGTGEQQTPKGKKKIVQGANADSLLDLCGFPEGGCAFRINLKNERTFQKKNKDDEPPRNQVD